MQDRAELLPDPADDHRPRLTSAALVSRHPAVVPLPHPQPEPERVMHVLARSVCNTPIVK
jgi:hypothetical protein